MYLKAKTTLESQKTNKKLSEMMKSVGEASRQLLVPPSHVSRLYWDCVMTVVFLYYLLVVPTSLAQAVRTTTGLGQRVLDHLCDLLLFADVCLRCSFFASTEAQCDRQAVCTAFLASSRCALSMLVLLPNPNSNPNLPRLLQVCPVNACAAPNRPRRLLGRQARVTPAAEAA